MAYLCIPTCSHCWANVLTICNGLGYCNRKNRPSTACLKHRKHLKNTLEQRREMLSFSVTSPIRYLFGALDVS